MPIAAVPAYLGNDFADASPGLRFGLLLPIWTDRRDQEADVNKRAAAKSPEGREVAEMLRREGMDATIRQLREPPRPRIAGRWEKNDFAARDAWKRIRAITVHDKKRMEALVRRQALAADSIPNVLRFDAVAVAPFTTGLGNEHPLENGFAFLNPYGLPYLAGSGVKGVLRCAARELAEGEWENDRGWKGLHGPCYRLEIRRGKEAIIIQLSVLDVLFGLESGSGDTEHVRGALSFWDVIPRIEGDSLMVEIMTPHQSHYYQINKKQNPQPPHFQSPHDSGQPNPICFLTVPPRSRFAFHVVCDTAHLARLTKDKSDGAPDLLALADGRPLWQTLLSGAFEHAFEWLGFGAKTAVGYGAMQRDPQAEARAAKERAEREAAERAAREAAEKEARRAAMSEAMRRIDDFRREFAARAEQLRGGKERPNGVYHGKARDLAKLALDAADWSAEEKRAAADAIEEWLPKVVQVDIRDERRKLKLAALRGQA
jgi:CRISPR-associated protein Cmr6